MDLKSVQTSWIVVDMMQLGRPSDDWVSAAVPRVTRLHPRRRVDKRALVRYRLFLPLPSP